MNHTRLAAALAAVLLLSACRGDSRPAHERLAEWMLHSRADPQLEHLTERYGPEDFTMNTEDYTGGIRSARFDMWVQLRRNEETQTYQDNYIVYLRQEELVSLLEDAFGAVFGGSRICATPYLYCPSSFSRDTPAETLLDPSAYTDDILVTASVFTAKDPADRDADLEALREAVQSRGWSLSIHLEYMPEEHLALIPENASGNPFHSGIVPDSALYLCAANAEIRPDAFRWSFGGWKEGRAQAEEDSREESSPSLNTERNQAP